MEKLDINKSLNAPMRAPINLKFLDGKKIVHAIQYQFLLNLNLTLLEYDKNSNLNTLLAEDYEIHENTIIFQIKKGVKTVGGHEIKAKDAEVSLKRLINSNNGSHSRLAELLCPEETSIRSQDCSGISSSEHELKIVTRKKSYIPFVLSLLTNADNVIYPLTALDNKTPSSSIINFKETSGPYYIEMEKILDKEYSNVKLIPNKNHFLYSSKIPQEVNYTVTNFDELVSGDKKLNPKFNYIHNVAGLKLSQVNEIKDNDKSIKIFPTLMLKNTMIFTTESGRKKFLEKELMFTSLLIRNKLLGSTKHFPNIVEPQVEYFPLSSEGNLTSEQHVKVLDKYSEILKNPIKLSTKIKIGLFKFSYDKYKEELDKINTIQIILLKGSPFDNNSDSVDIFIDTIDSSFTESLDLLQYNKTFGIFDVSDEDMKKYVDADLKEKRIKLLQEIHFKSLMNARFVTLGAAPYYTFLSKEWSAEPSKLFVGFPVWKIFKKD